MKNIKPIVQVMNLFSLVRINSAKSKVEEFGMTSSVLTKIISSIMYNDNIVLDKNSIEPDASKPVLNIYIASDYGFCSSYNQVVSQKIKAINEKSYSKIVIYYNHYYNFSKSEFTSMQVFPVVYDESAKENVDFLIETDIKSFINNLIVYYVCYELEICEIFSWASENVIRNAMTSSALKKLDELEMEEKLRELRKIREKGLKKNIENSKKVIFTNNEDDDDN